MVYFKSYDTKLTSFIWKWFLFLLFFSFSHFCFAQITPQPAFRNLTTDDGLPSSEVYEVHEDSNGYLWFSTDNGVSRYDGYTFKNFGADDGLSCNVVFHFFEDHTGRLWMNSLTGEFFYFEDERFYPYEFNHIIKGYQERYWGVGRFFFDHERTLFFKMNSVGILKIDSLGKDTIYGRNNYGATILEISGRALSSVVFTDSSVDTLTGNSLARTLHKNDISTIQLINGKSAEKILYQRGVSSRSKNMRLIHLGPQEYLFLYGMEVLHIKDQALVWQSPEPFSKFLPCFKQMEDGTIFISHDNGKGIRKYKDLKAVKNEDYELWLDDIIISDVFIDSKGGYWFTTIGNGVYYVPSSSIKVFNEESGLRSSNISTFAIKDHTSIYFADQEGDFYLLNHQRNQIQALPKSDQDVPIISLYYDTSTNILWSGAPPLRFFEKKEWKDLITDSDRKRSIKGTLIRVKPSADYKSLWGGGPFGFASIDLDINRLNILSSEIEGLKRTRTFVVYENSKKQIFVSNLNGFFELTRLWT
jgi:ligand-binding sensor domain-containing protein